MFRYTILDENAFLFWVQLSKRKGDEKKDSRIGMTLQISPRDVCVFEKVIASVHCGLSDRDQRDTKEDLEMREVSIKD